MPHSGTITGTRNAPPTPPAPASGNSAATVNAPGIIAAATSRGELPAAASASLPPPCCCSLPLRQHPVNPKAAPRRPIKPPPPYGHTRADNRNTPAMAPTRTRAGNWRKSIPAYAGEPDKRRRSRRLRKSIPAYAGEPLPITGQVESHIVYPRVCGGTTADRRLAAYLERLSPRMRGNPWLRARTAPFKTSIPACAGEPMQSFDESKDYNVYPRVCGGTRYRRTSCKHLNRLSPRVRGNPPNAGTTDQENVYPRVCGGTHPSPSPRVRPRRLSPRVRGNHAGLVSPPLWLTSIPACAGEPLEHGRSVGQHSVYPRVCGGTPATQYSGNTAPRLSPRMRGNRLGQQLWEDSPTSIPAYAGEPAGAAIVGGQPYVYPRVCGGTLSTLPLGVTKDRLSPRMRGNPAQGRGVIGSEKSIPAYAGEPACRRPRTTADRIYPRVCGGTYFTQRAPRCQRRLSPRMRGNPTGL